MRQFRWVSLLLLPVATWGCTAMATPDQESKATFPLEAVISQVKHELSAAQNTPGDSLGLALEKVEIALAVSHARDASGKVTVGVPALYAEIGGKGSRKAESLSTLQVELAPPAGSMTLSRPDLGQLGLAQMIVDTRRQLAAGVSEPPPLDARKVTMTVKFGVTRSGGGAGGIQLVVFRIGGEANIASGSSNAVTLTFARSDAP